MTPEREEDGESAFILGLRSSLSRVWADPRIEPQRREGEGSSKLVSLETPGSQTRLARAGGGVGHTEACWPLGHVITTDVSSRCGVPTDSAALHPTFCWLAELGTGVRAPRNAGGAGVDPCLSQ